MQMPRQATTARYKWFIAVLVALIMGVCLRPSIVQADNFYEAMKREDSNAMSRFIDQVEDANMRLEDGRTALMIAAKLGANDVVAKLLNAGARINDVNANGGTALMYAAIRGDKATLMLLVEHGANVNAAAKFGWTALMVAAAKGHADIVPILIEHGAKVNVRDIYQWTPLMRSAFSGYYQSVAALLNHDQTDVNAQDENGATALHHAATNGFVDIVELLLKYNASTKLKDRFDMNARDRALANKHIAIVNLLSSTS